MKGSCPRLGERPRAQSPDPSWPRFQQTQALRACTDSGSGCLGALKGKSSSASYTPQSPALGGAWGCRCGVRASRGDRGEIRFRPRTVRDPCSPAALSGERSAQCPERLPPLPPARAVLRALAGIAAPTSRPCTPQLREPLVLHGGARLSYRAAAPGGSSVPRRAGHFFFFWQTFWVRRAEPGRAGKALRAGRLRPSGNFAEM